MCPSFRQILRSSVWSLLVCLAVASAWPARAQTPRKLTLRDMLEDNGYTSLPFKVSSGNDLYLEGKAGGQSVRCDIDTGWGYYSAIAHRLGRKHGEPAARPEGADSDDEFVSLKDFRLGGYAFPETTFHLFNLRIEKYDSRSIRKHVALAAPTAKSYEVMLGIVDLVRHHAIINYPQRILHLRAEPLDPLRALAIRKSLQQVGYLSIPMEVREVPAFFVPCRLNDEEGRLLVDTGAFGTCIHAPTAIRLTGRQIRAKGMVLGFRGREAEAGLAEFERLAVGPWERTKFEVAAMDLTPWGLGSNRSPKLAGVRGLLGGDILGTAGAMMDCGNGHLFLLPPAK